MDASDEKELEELTNKLKNGLDIKDRKYLLTEYPKCFVGNEAVTHMVDSKLCESREEAVHLGQMLMAANVIRHVTSDHDFKDEKKFYMFTSDEPSHGQKAKNEETNEDWSWSDFIPGRFKKDDDENKYNLQPTIEELNTEVTAAVDADELAPKETFGISPLDEYNQLLLDNVHPVKWVPPKPQAKYNMVAIGAGAAGLVTAAGTAGLGGKVAIVEEHMFGGDCLNFGCVPSKAILRSARVAHDAIMRGQEFGLELVDGGDLKEKLRMNFGKVMERVRKIRSEISAHDACERFTKAYNMDVYIGHARFVSQDTIKVGEHELKFARCVIATGAKASVPPIAGLSEVEYLTNQSIWNLTELPRRFGVIGSGPIGSELAQAFALLGSKVTVLNRSARILGKEDREAADIVAASMEECGVTFVTGIKFKSVCYKDASVGHKSGIVVKIVRNGKNEEKEAKEEEFEFDQLLIATGRKPNVEGMDLELAKVKFDARRGIEVNDFLQTSNGNIYAAGDCCTRFQFTHMADAMARIVIRNSLFFGRSKVSDLIIPWTTYTFPEVAHVGLYESDLKARNIAYDAVRIELNHNDRAICDGEAKHNGFVKVFTKKGGDNILGATIVSDNAGDQINEFTLAIQANIGLGFLGAVIHSYPTVSEAVKHAGDAFNRTRLTPVTKTLLRKVLSARR
eukprot:CAMPEP_0197030630 /NCGR_PEP_ID=MMETSP1384-20130603/9829_1 /TAXON_ID=29189 /ORGANISM="Ammonia sp." /LENGTH=679 /DNA_ID=CAMNT_0042460017 /DNA_START=57 /DNA_END=2096 /DNA_ORIENTATION=-